MLAHESGFVTHRLLVSGMLSEVGVWHVLLGPEIAFLVGTSLHKRYSSKDLWQMVVVVCQCIWVLVVVVGSGARPALSTVVCK